MFLYGAWLVLMLCTLDEIKQPIYFGTWVLKILKKMTNHTIATLKVGLVRGLIRQEDNHHLHST